jgi:hypothetical protein
MMTLENSSQAIPELNDKFRKTFIGGQVLVTAGVQALSAEQQQAIFQAVQGFDVFTEDNDPYGEHDFGAFSIAGQRFNWKIDYYDPSMQWRSEDPADPQQTRRVLTILLAEEY